MCLYEFVVFFVMSMSEYDEMVFVFGVLVFMFVYWIIFVFVYIKYEDLSL